MKVSISRNKREGYYAGYYRSCADFERKTKRRHRRWSRFAMYEFYLQFGGLFGNMFIEEDRCGDIFWL